MPLLRPHLSSLWDWDLMLDRSRPSRLFDQNFGLTLDDEQIFAPAGVGAGGMGGGYSLFPYVGGNYRPRRLHSKQESGVSQVACDRDKFEVKLDVTQFSGSDLVVKTVGNVVVIEGKHDEREDEHGYIQRHFIRKYVLPADVKPEAVICNLSSDGVLSITANRTVEEEAEPVKVVPIIQTGRPAAVVRQSSTGGTTSAPAGNSTSGNTTLINIQRETSNPSVAS